MTAAALPKRFSVLPSKFSADANKRTSTGKPASNPFSFNSYASKQPAPQTAAQPVPFDPADLTRRLERYLASLESEADAAPKPARPATASRQASSTSVTRHAAAPSKSKQNNNGANRPLLQPRTKSSATASAHSPASPNPGAVGASLSKKSSFDRGGPPALASRAVADSPRSKEDLLTLEALRQEAKRATRRAVALQASKGLNTPVEAGELAKRLNALAAVDSAVAQAPTLQPKLKNGSDVNVRRSPSAPCTNEKRTRTAQAQASDRPSLPRRSSSTRKRAEVRLAAGIEHEREKTRAAKEAAAYGSRRRTSANFAAAGSDADQLWRGYMSTQQQALVQERQSALRKSASGRRARPYSTTKLNLAGRKNGDRVLLLKSRSTGFIESSGSSGRSSCDVSSVVGRRPDWTQRDEVGKVPLSPLHLHLPGFSRRDSVPHTTEAQSADERGVVSDVEDKKGRTAETRTNNRQSVRGAYVASPSPLSSATAATTRAPRCSQPQPPTQLRIPSPRSSSGGVQTAAVAPSSISSPRSPHSSSTPSITLSPVDCSDPIHMHFPSFSAAATNKISTSSRTSTSTPPTLTPLRHSSSFEARLPKHLLNHHQQDDRRHQYLAKSSASTSALAGITASGERSPQLASLPEISPLPAPDRFSKTKPSMLPRSKSANFAAADGVGSAIVPSLQPRPLRPVQLRSVNGSTTRSGGASAAVSPTAAVPWPGPMGARGTGMAAATAMGRQPWAKQRAALGGWRSQSAMEMRERDASSGENSSESGSSSRSGRRKSVTFVASTASSSSSAPAAGSVPGAAGVGPVRREREKASVVMGMRRSSTLPVKSREEKGGSGKEVIEGAHGHGVARLVFWRRDSKVVDELAEEQQHHHHHHHHGSRLAFWKKGR